MSIMSGYGKFKRYLLTNEGYKLCSQWTSSNTVYFDDGNTAQTKLGAINGITDSLTVTSSNVALSANAGKNLQDQITELNTGMIIVKPINLTDNFTSSVDYAYTGVSVSVPAGSFYSITAIANFNYGRPTSIGISISSTSSVQMKATNHESNGSASCTMTGNTNVNLTLYIWASYNNVSTNTIYLNGFYLCRGK